MNLVLFALAGEVVWVLVVLIVLAIKILSAVGDMLAQKPPAPRPPRDPNVPNVPNEVEEFLRRASAQNAPRQPPEQAGAIVPLSPRGSDQPSVGARGARGRSGGRSRPRPSTDPQPVPVEVLDEAPVGDEVSQQVRKYLDTGAFSRRSQQLGEEVVQSDQQFEDRLKETFRGDVGRLAKRPGESATPPEPEVATASPETAVPLALASAAGIAAILASPDGLQQAILLNEVLRRRDDVWE